MGEAKLLRRRHSTGVVLLFAAALLWSISGALIKLAHREGADGVTIAFYRSLFAGLFLLPFARRKFHTLTRHVESRTADRAFGKELLSGERRSWLFFLHIPISMWNWLRTLRPAALSCVVFFTLMTVCFVIANTKTEAANAIILQYTSTIWVFGLSPWLLAEKPRAKELWLLGLVMIGIAVIFGGNAATDLMGLLIALAAGLFYALLTIMIRIMRDSDPAAVTVLNNLGSAALLLPAALLAGNLMVSRRALGLLVVMGVVQFGLPYYLFTLGLARVKAYQAALITLAEPVLVPLWAYLAVRERVPAATLIGGGVILMALVLLVRVTRTSGRNV